MSAFEKEKIFIELRKYHLEGFPKTLSSQEMTSLLVEYKEIEDAIVSMIFGLVNGKTAYVDFSTQLKDFDKKARPGISTNKIETSDRELFLSKSSQLSTIINIAAAGNFKLRPVRNPKIIRSTNPREVKED